MGKRHGKERPDGVIGPESFVTEALKEYGLQPKDVKVHASDFRSQLIVEGDQPVARFAWIRRGLSPRPKDSKPSKEEKKDRKKLKKAMKRRTRAISSSA